MRLCIDIDDTLVSQQLIDTAAFIEYIEQRDEDHVAPFCLWVDYTSADYSKKFYTEFEKVYNGEHASVADFARYYYKGVAGTYDSAIDQFMDWERYGLYLLEGGKAFYKLPSDNGYYIFRRL